MERNTNRFVLRESSSAGIYIREGELLGIIACPNPPCLHWEAIPRPSEILGSPVETPALRIPLGFAPESSPRPCTPLLQRPAAAEYRVTSALSSTHTASPGALGSRSTIFVSLADRNESTPLPAQQSDSRVQDGQSARDSGTLPLSRAPYGVRHPWVSSRTNR